jgi:benzoate/toluate 1,2-dioxygenase alpha subunit
VDPLGQPEDRPAYERRDELAADFGQARADWMIENSRNLCLYPNVYLMDQFSSQIRIARPISVNKTEITIYCIAPKGESAEARARASASTRTSSTSAAWPPRTTWKSSAPARRLRRRHRLERHVPRRAALGRRCRRGGEGDRPQPLLSGVRTEDEGLFVLQHKYWQETMIKALKAEQQLIPVEAVQ